MTELAYLIGIAPLLLMPNYQHTEEATRMAAKVLDAIDRTVGRKQAAVLMEVSEPNLSHQGAGRKAMDVRRLVKLPQEFWDALLERIAEDSGGMYLKKAVVSVLRGAGELRKPRMAKAYAAERKSA